MRICVLGPARSIHTRRWVEALAERGHDITYLNVSAQPRQFRGVQVVDIRGGRLRRLQARRAAIRELRPDVVHQHSLPATPANLTFWRIPRLVVSSWGGDAVRNDPYDERRRPALAGLWQRFLLRQATAITATSRFLAAETGALAPADADITVIPFGVDCETFSPQRRAPSSGRDDVTIGFIKHLESRYGPEQLVRAFAILAKKHLGAQLVMIGEGSMRQGLERLTQELGVADRVTLTGRIPHQEVPSALAGLDIYVMPSMFKESFGVSALEASAMELPVVASATGGVPEVVVDGETGFLVPPGDVDALAAAVERLIEDPDRRWQMGRQGREWVLSRYKWGDSVLAMEKLYKLVRSGGGT
jgi:glycosyltransferase involved in cell wall biosynthesis